MEVHRAPKHLHKGKAIARIQQEANCCKPRREVTYLQNRSRFTDLQNMNYDYQGGKVGRID